MLRYKKIGVLLIFTIIFSFSAFIFQNIDKNGPDDNKYYPFTNFKENNLQSSGIESINLSLYENWNRTWIFSDKNNNTIMEILNIEGYNAILNCIVKNLRDSSSGEKYYPSNVSLSLYQFNSTNWNYLGTFTDIVNGSGYLFSEISIPETFPGWFAVGSDTNVTFDAYFTFIDNNTREIQAIYQQNRWTINYNSSYITGNYTSIISNLSSALDLELIRGYDGANWRPIIQYQFLENLSIFESFSKYLIEFSVQTLDVAYNDHLEVGDDLGLYIVPKVDGNLTVTFLGVNNEVLINDTQTVIMNKIINYSWQMIASYPGGTGELNIEFKGQNPYNVSNIETQIVFHKNALMGAELYAESGNSTKAFEQIVLLAQYVDMDNITLIPNATIEYQIGNFSGIMDYVNLADLFDNVTKDEYAYLKIIELSEFRLRPGNYTVKLSASKEGYQSATFDLPLEITTVFCYISTPLLLNNHLDIFLNKPFELDLDLLYFAWNSTWINIQDNVILNFSVYTPSHERIALWQLDTRYEDPELKGTIGSHDAYPGDFYFEIAVESPYYYGSTNISVTFKSEVNIYLLAPTIITHPDIINLNWISDGVFYGDMRGFVFIVVDSRIFSIQPILPVSFMQIDSNELSAGQHVIQVFILSDYYTGEFIRTIDVKLSFWEQYRILLFSIIGVLAIAVLVLSVYIRRKKKLKRKEWDSLGALMAIKDGMNMFTILRSKKSKYSYELSADEDLFTGMIEAIKSFAKEINLSSGDITRFQGDQGMITIIPENQRRFNLVFLSQDELKHIESDLRSIFVQSLRRYYDVHIGDWKGDLSVFKVYLNKAERLINADSIANAKKMSKKEKVYDYEMQS